MTAPKWPKMNKKERDERYSGGGEERVFRRWLTTTIIYSECLLLSFESSKSTTLKTLENEYTPFAVTGWGGLTLHYKHKIMPAGLISIYFMWHEADGSWINITWWSSAPFGCGVSPPPPPRHSTDIATPNLQLNGFFKNKTKKKIQDTAELRELYFPFPERALAN